MAVEYLRVGQSSGTYKRFVEAGSSWHAEEVTLGGGTRFVQVNMAPTTSQAYAAGDVIGGLLTLANVFRSTGLMSGLLQSIVVADKSTNQAAMDFLLFHTATTGTTYTNDAALTLADGDINKAIGFAQLSNYAAFADNGLGTLRNIGLPVRATTGVGLTAVAINRSSQPSYATTGDLIVTFGFLVD